MMAGGRFGRSFGLPFLPPAAKAGMAALPIGRKGGAEVRHDLREGQGGDSGEDERLGFGVGFDLGLAFGARWARRCWACNAARLCLVVRGG